MKKIKLLQTVVVRKRNHHPVLLLYRKNGLKMTDQTTGVDRGHLTVKKVQKNPADLDQDRENHQTDENHQLITVIKENETKMIITITVITVVVINNIPPVNHRRKTKGQVGLGPGPDRKNAAGRGVGKYEDERNSDLKLFLWTVKVSRQHLLQCFFITFLLLYIIVR